MGWPHAVSLRAQVSCGPQPTRGYCNPLFQHWNAAKSCWQYLLEGSLPQLKVFTTNMMDRESRVHANTTFAGFAPMLGPGKSLKLWPGPWTRKEFKTVACLPQVESGRRVFPSPCLVRDIMAKTICLSRFPWKGCGQDFIFT